MKKHVLLLLLTGCFGTAILLGSEFQEGISPALVSASRALEEGLPQVAEQKIRLIISGTLSENERNIAVSKLAESLIEQGQGENALKELNTAKLTDDPATGLLRARALMSLGKWAEALSAFKQCKDSGGQKDESLRVAAQCGQAECLQVLGKSSEALTLLRTIRNPGTLIQLRKVELAVATGDFKQAQETLNGIASAKAGVNDRDRSELLVKRWKKYLEARLLLAKGNAAQAVEGFEEIIRSPKGTPEGVFAAAVFGLTEARMATGGMENADNVLEDFIWQHPNSSYLEIAFRRLDQIYSMEEDASDSELEKWAEKEPPRRAALALYYFACMELREGKEDRALKKFQQFARTYPDHPLTARAFSTAGQILSGEAKFDAALACFESAMRVAKDSELLAEIEMMTGLTEFQKGDFVLASNRFHSAAGHSERLWEQATFNSALTWLNQGNFEKFREDYKEISRRFPDSKFRPEMLLEEGLLEARTGDPKAREAFALFLKDFPNHPRVVDAQLALAELAFVDSDSASAQRYLKVALESPASPQTAEQAALLEIFHADSLLKGDRGQKQNKADDARVIELCQQFLKQSPGSELIDQVRMKLGQIFFRIEDYPNAQTQFERLANESPNSPLCEAALFLAGQSSMRSMNPGGVDRAIEIFQQVAERKGSLKLYARQQQAIAYTRLGKEKEAVILYDEILGGSPPADLRFAVLAGKGDSLLTSAGKDEKLIAQAIPVFDQLATQPDVTAFWRNQALYKKAKCLEAMAQAEQALVVYYDILQVQAVPGNEGPDYTWYYKAGFDAAAALEAQEQWKAAIGIYEKMANLLGPRSEEAKKRVDQLRLEHFIWEE